VLRIMRSNSLLLLRCSTSGARALHSLAAPRGLVTRPGGALSLLAADASSRAAAAAAVAECSAALERVYGAAAAPASAETPGGGGFGEKP
jgi:hypothetical protein